MTGSRFRIRVGEVTLMPSHPGVATVGGHDFDGTVNADDTLEAVVPGAGVVGTVTVVGIDRREVWPRWARVAIYDPKYRLDWLTPGVILRASQPLAD